MSAEPQRDGGATDSEIRADLIVVGFGKGGKPVAAAMGARGKRVVLIERSERMYGGTCPNVGCVPTKGLVHQSGQRRPDDPPQEFYEAAVHKVQAVREMMRKGNIDGLESFETVTVLTGEARFVDPHTVEVDTGETVRVSGETVLINAGSEPVVPGIPGLRESAHLIGSTELIESTRLPERLAIIGGGYLGIELAAIYRHFGSEVTVIEAARGPVTGHLGLDAAGVHTDARGAIEVDEHLRTAQPHIFALGDVNGGPQFTYVSLDDARIVLDQLVGEGRRTTTDRVAVPRTLFTTPPLANVGLTEREAREQGRHIKVMRE